MSEFLKQRKEQQHDSVVHHSVVQPDKAYPNAVDLGSVLGTISYVVILSPNMIKYG